MADCPFDASSIEGRTADGIAWRWRDVPIQQSTLLLFPDVGVPTEDDRWRFEQSLRAFALFDYLKLPVTSTWIVPPAAKPRSRWTVEDDFFPQWEIRPGDRHAFLFGIVDRLWDCLEFDPHPPSRLEVEWRACVQDEDEDEESPRHRPRRGLVALTAGGLHKLLGKQSDSATFVGGNLPPTNLERLL